MTDRSTESARRSTRVRARIPVLITTPDTTVPFSLRCETLLVNAHGCAVKVPQPLEPGMPLCLRIRESGQVTARVVVCQPIRGEQPSWIVGLELDKPGNVWGLTAAPEDWARVDQEAEDSKARAPALPSAPIELKMPLWPLASQSSRGGLPAKAQEELKTQLTRQQQMIASLDQRLTTSLASLDVIRKQVADVQQETSAHTRAHFDAQLSEALSRQSAAQADEIARLEERLAASVAALPAAIQHQLAESQREALAQTRKQFDAMLAESLPQQSAAHNEAIGRLQERLAALESLTSEFRQQLSIAHEQTQAQIRQQIGVSLGECLRPLQDELASCQSKAEEGQNIRVAIAEQLEQLPRHIQEQCATCIEPLRERAQAQLESVVAGAKSRDEQAIARWQALEASNQAVRSELAQARALLESSTYNVLQRIQEPVTTAVQEALARVRAEVSADVARELEMLRERGRVAADELRAMTESLHSEREAALAQLVAGEAKREELQLWLAEQQTVLAQHVDRQLGRFSAQQSAYAEELKQKLEELADELAARSARMLDEQIRSDAEQQVERVRADLRVILGPTLERASALHGEVLSLLDALQKENEHCQRQISALRQEKQNVDGWVKERSAEFQTTFRDALVETTGQIRGRLQMAEEMMQAPFEKLREQAAQQLHDQASRQTQLLREYADEVAEHLRALQRDIETALRRSLQAQAAETAATCGREIAEIAERSVAQWRSALARNLGQITSLLNQHLPPEHQQR